MSNPGKSMQADVVVVGSGPGGATVARELSRKGKKVIICEAGAYHKQFGYSIFMADFFKRGNLGRPAKDGRRGNCGV